MELSQLSVQIMLIFFPGILCKIVFHKLFYYKEKDIAHFLVNSFVFGFIAYITYYLALKVLSIFQIFPVPTSVKFFESINSGNVSVDVNEILLVSGISVINGSLFAWLFNKDYLLKFARYLRITKQFSEHCVWKRALNQKGSDWIQVRDLRNKLYFDGWLHSYSDDNNNCELFLADATIYAENGKKLISTPGIYISRNSKELIVEFPKLNLDTLKKEKEEQ